MNKTSPSIGELSTAQIKEIWNILVSGEKSRPTIYEDIRHLICQMSSTMSQNVLKSLFEAQVGEATEFLDLERKNGKSLTELKEYHLGVPPEGSKRNYKDCLEVMQHAIYNIEISEQTNVAPKEYRPGITSGVYGGVPVMNPGGYVGAPGVIGASGVVQGVSPWGYPVPSWGGALGVIGASGVVPEVSSWGYPPVNSWVIPPGWNMEISLPPFYPYGNQSPRYPIVTNKVSPPSSESGSSTNQEKGNVQPCQREFTPNKIVKCEIIRSGWCYLETHRNGSVLHDPEKTICLYMYNSPRKGCYANNCPYQHPNPGLLQDIQKVCWENWSELYHLNDKIKQKAFYMCNIQLEKDVCKLGNNCEDKLCNKQHKIGKLFPPVMIDPESYAADVDTRTDVTSSIQHITHVKMIMTAQGKLLDIVKLEQLKVPYVKKRYEALRNECRTQNKPFSTLNGFHGTVPQNIEAIINNGFDMTKVIRTTYGPGLYFAHDAGVSVSYCKHGKQMFMCELLDVATKWDKNTNYYIVQDERAILPLYLITFS